MNNNSYKNKYLKYKNKYLDLKEGGSYAKDKKKKEKNEKKEKDKQIKEFKKSNQDLYKNYKEYIELLINSGFSNYNTRDIIDKINEDKTEDGKEEKKVRLKKLIEYKIELDKKFKLILTLDNFIYVLFKNPDYSQINNEDNINKVDEDKIKILVSEYLDSIKISINGADFMMKNPPTKIIV